MNGREATSEFYQVSKGKDRTRVSLSARAFGDGIVVYIYNENAHLGAVAVGEYDTEHRRASVSVVTRLGHKDDAIARKAAHAISKQTGLPSCVIAGVHLDNIAEREIQDLLKRADEAVKEFLDNWPPPPE